MPSGWSKDIDTLNAKTSQNSARLGGGTSVGIPVRHQVIWSADAGTSAQVPQNPLTSTFASGRRQVSIVCQLLLSQLLRRDDNRKNRDEQMLTGCEATVVAC